MRTQRGAGSGEAPERSPPDRRRLHGRRGRAADLDPLLAEGDPRKALTDVIALGPLASWLRLEKMEVPDPEVRAVVVRPAESVDEMHDHEEIVRRYEEAMAERQAIHDLRALMSEGLEPTEQDPECGPVATGGGEGR